MRYPDPIKRGGDGSPVSHYLVAVDPGVARPGVSVWFVDRHVDRLGAMWLPRLVCGRAPRLPAHMHNPGAAAVYTVRAVEAAIATMESNNTTTRSARPRSVRPVVLVVEWPVKYATKTATHDSVEDLRAMIRSLPWTPRLKAKPAEWKGAVPKAITDDRTIAALVDRGIVVPTERPGGWPDRVDDDPNARDAVALGAWALGIVGRGCVRA